MSMTTPAPGSVPQEGQGTATAPPARSRARIALVVGIPLLVLVLLAGAAGTWWVLRSRAPQTLIMDRLGERTAPAAPRSAPSEAWRYAAPEGQSVHPALLADGRVVADAEQILLATGTGLVAVSAADGQERWAFTAPEGWQQAQVLRSDPDGLLVVDSHGDEDATGPGLARLDRESGEVAWSDAEHRVLAVGTSVVLLSGDAQSPEGTGATAVDMATGEELWSSPELVPESWDGDVTPLRLVVADDGTEVLLRTDGAAVTALDATTGEELWALDPEVPEGTGGDRSARTAVLGDALVLAPDDGTIRMLDLLTGEQRWRTEDLPEDAEISLVTASSFLVAAISPDDSSSLPDQILQIALSDGSVTLHEELPEDSELPALQRVGTDRVVLRSERGLRLLGAAGLLAEIDAAGMPPVIGVQQGE